MKAESGAAESAAGSEGDFRSLMSPEEAAKYDGYWRQGTGVTHSVKEDGVWVKKILGKGDVECTRQRQYTTPGTKSIIDVKLGKNGEMYYRETVFDQFGRKIGHNDYTDHGEPWCHSNPHYHPNPVSEPSQHGKGLPGLHPDTPGGDTK